MIIQDIEIAAQVIKKGGIIGMPTETVYGLAGSAYSESAIRSIYAIKNRPYENPLIVHIPSESFLDDLVTFIPDELRLLIHKFSPGPITFLLPKKERVSSSVTAGKANVAVRIPNHPMAQKLLFEVNLPLVAPSANPFQRISPVSAKQVNKYFEKDNLIVLDGGVSYCGIESTIVGFENNKVVLNREGYITQIEIEEVLNASIVNNSNSKIIEAPGMYNKHYSPLCDMVVATNLQKEIDRWNDKKIGILTLGSTNYNAHANIFLSETNSTKEAVSKVYNALHELEEQQVDIIISEFFPNDHYGTIINERLLKASYK
jgi:L-threonylcarbamoyladenylate synthase